MSAKHLFTDADRCRLGQLLSAANCRSGANCRDVDELEWQLEKARTLPGELIPDDVVTMNSQVRLIALNSGKERTCTLVYPEDADLFEDSVSVLDPFGSRMLGSHVGDLVEWDKRDKNGSWRVAEIVFQPERSGAYHL